MVSSFVIRITLTCLGRACILASKISLHETKGLNIKSLQEQINKSLTIYVIIYLIKYSEAELFFKYIENLAKALCALSSSIRPNVSQNYAISHRHRPPRPGYILPILNSDYWRCIHIILNSSDKFRNSLKSILNNALICFV